MKWHELVLFVQSMWLVPHMSRVIYKEARWKAMLDHTNYHRDIQNSVRLKISTFRKIIWVSVHQMSNGSIEVNIPVLNDCIQETIPVLNNYISGSSHSVAICNETLWSTQMNPVTSIPYHQVAMPPCHNLTKSTMSPCYNVTIPPCEHATMSPCYNVTMPQCLYKLTR